MVNSYLITFSNGNADGGTFVSHPPLRINMWTRRSLVIHFAVLPTFRRNPEIATEYRAPASKRICDVDAAIRPTSKAPDTSAPSARKPFGIPRAALQT